MNVSNDTEFFTTTNKSINRPLVVFAGQGLSLADNFNLTKELRKRAPELFQLVPEPDRNDLDLVLQKYREHPLGETPEERHKKDDNHRKIHDLIRQLTKPEVLFARGLNTVFRLSAILRELSKKRIVILFTSNVDRACRLAAIENGAEWFFGHSFIGATSLQDILRWIEAIKYWQRGFHYFPLHGEPDFGSTGDGGLYFATQPHFHTWCPAGQPWFYPTAEGLGHHARIVDSRWSIPKHGYQLLRDFLTGSYEYQQLHSGADLVVVGYGAGATRQRCNYPFERSIQDIINKGKEQRGNWYVVSLFRDGVKRDQDSLRWFTESGFVPYIVGDPEPTCNQRLEEILSQL